jgi:hypothetical protein
VILSASRMNMWMSCPLQAQMKYHLNLPREQSGAATFGSIMHEILEYLNHHPDPSSELALTQSKNLFLTWWADPESLNKTYAVDWWPQRTSYDTYRAKGLEVLELVHRKLRFNNRTLLATEIPYKQPSGATARARTCCASSTTSSAASSRPRLSSRSTCSSRSTTGRWAARSSGSATGRRSSPASVTVRP